MQGKYEIHPAANIFPMMSKEELERLAADIKENGQREPIGLYDGKILDGRNREAACNLAGVEPDYADLVEDDGEDATFDPVQYVLSENLHRRQLKTSQKAMCAAKLAGLPRGANQHSKGEGVSNDTSSIDEAAKLFGVGRASVCRALEVLRNAAAKVVELCEVGELSVSKAAQFIEETPDKKQQARIAKGGKAAIVADMKSVDEVEPVQESPVAANETEPTDLALAKILEAAKAWLKANKARRAVLFCALENFIEANR